MKGKTDLERNVPKLIEGVSVIFAIFGLEHIVMELDVESKGESEEQEDVDKDELEDVGRDDLGPVDHGGQLPVAKIVPHQEAKIDTTEKDN